jgi:tRNA A-37 threonylcarbamoyl transferase component Bud32
MVEDNEGAPPPSARHAPVIEPELDLPSAISLNPIDDPEPPATATGSGGPKSAPVRLLPESRPGTGGGGSSRPSARAGSSRDDQGRSLEADLEVGTIFEIRPGLKLVLERVLGKGGMGVVYLVHDPKLGRRMALKLIRGRQSSVRIVRFLRETRVTARLNHPGIPPVNEAGTTAQGVNYLLMRFVAGESLKRRLRKLWSGGHRPSKSDTRDLLQALCRMGEAVAYAHSERVIHRDLKPENIMIGDFGETFVMDWGLARDLDESAQEDVSICEAVAANQADNVDPKDSDALAATQGLTRMGATLGTVGYMAPEQARGEPIDQRADVFSLGVILTRILTGHSALGDAPLERLQRTKDDEILTPLEIDGNVPPELDAIAERATLPNRDDRYDMVEHLVTDVRAYLQGGKVSAYDYQPWHEAYRVVKRHPVVMVMALAILAIGLVGFGVRSANTTAKAVEVDRFVVEGNQALDAGDPERALASFHQALGVNAESFPALSGKVRAESEFAKLQATKSSADQIQLTKVRDEEKAKRYEVDAEASIRRQDYRSAMEAADLAAAFGSTKAGELRDQAHELRVVELARKKSEEFRSRAVGLVAKALSFERKGDPREALRLFHSALAFNHEDEEAIEGVGRIHDAIASKEALREAKRKAELADERKGIEDRRLRAEEKLARAEESRLAVEEKRKAEEEKRKHQNERRQELERKRAQKIRSVKEVDLARTRLKAGKEAYLRGDSTLAVLDLHLEGLEAADRAIFLDTSNKDAKRVKQQIGQQLAAILRQEGHSKFESEFVLRFSGSNPDENHATIPRDPNLEIREGDAVRIRQVLGTTRFKRTRAFDKLRRFVKKTFPSLRVIIVVRSNPVPGHPTPEIHFTGLWVQVEDKTARTVRPPHKISVPKRFIRPMSSDKLGRIIGSFDEARDQSRIDAQALVKEVELVAHRLLREATR